MRKIIQLGFAILPAVFVATLGAQPTSPPRRAHHSLVYDDAGKRVLLWGGSTPTADGNAGVFFNDLWAFDGTKWTALGEAGTKGSGAPLAYDSRRNRVVSFGGYNRESLGELRVLEGVNWTTVGQHPELRAAEAGFVYDAGRDRFVTFGGSAGPRSAHGDTWELSGTVWNKVSAAGPPARQQHIMAFDAKRNRTVLFGGMGVGPPGQPSPRLNDTWEFDGTTWTQKQTAGPGARMGAGATYDSKRGLVVIFGGLGADGFYGDTWSWDGSTWQKLADTGPEPRGMGYLAYDRERDRIVLFGGRKGWPNDLNDTWEFDGTTWRRVADQ